jgi:hypothetical protein
MLHEDDANIDRERECQIRSGIHDVADYFDASWAINSIS